jgi:RecG-like helicase
VPIVSAEIADETGTIKATWFGRRGLAGKLVPGERVFVHGRAALKRTRGSLGVELNVLHHKLLGEDEPYEGSVVPIYRASKDVSSRVVATTIERNIEALAGLVRDVIPHDVLAARGYGPLTDAWRTAHR